MRKPFNEVAGEDTDHGIKVVRGILNGLVESQTIVCKKNPGLLPRINKSLKLLISYLNQAGIRC